MADKNPFLEDKKSNSIKEDSTKIGFNTNPPLAKGQTVEKFQETLPGKELRGWTKACTILGIIFSVISMMYFLLPLFSFIIGALIALCLVLFMILSVVGTLGLALLNEDYRNWIGNNMMDVPNFFFNIADNIAKLSPFYFVAAGPALAFTIAGLILSIIGKAKKYRFFTSYIVLNSIFLSIALLFSIIYLIGGGVILSNN